MIDTHCHIDFEDYDSDREEVIKRAQDCLDLVIASGFNKKAIKMFWICPKNMKVSFIPHLDFTPSVHRNQLTKN